MMHGVFDQGLQRHRRNQNRQDGFMKHAFHTQSVLIAQQLNAQVLIRDLHIFCLFYTSAASLFADELEKDQNIDGFN